MTDAEMPATRAVTGPGDYPVPAGLHRVTQTIQRSRFITSVQRAADPGAARTFVESVRADLPDATHHCWAFVAGPPGSTTHIGMSDAGEPRGTAGKPMLTTLLHGGVGEIVAVCTRYYGGVKLGTGGLSRAYAGGVKLALADLPTERKVIRVALEIVTDYASAEAVQRIVARLDGVVDDTNWSGEVRFTVRVAEEAEERLRREVMDATRGRGDVRRGPA